MTTTYPLKCRIRAAADGEPTRVDVYDDIGPGGWFSDGLTAKDFTATLAGVSGALEVHINSAGGDVFDGIAILNAIRGHKGAKTTVVDGLAASIASVIAQAGDDRVVQPSSMFMIHDAFGYAVGNAAEMAAMATTLDKVSGNIADVYADRSAKGTAATWRDAMKAETWYTADEAVAAGLADRVGDGSAELPAGLDLAAFTSLPGRIAARLRSLPQASAAHGPGHEHAPGGDAGHGDGQAGDGPADRAGKPRGEAQPGACCEMCGPDCACATGTAARAPRRVLGRESMPLADKALPVHHTATVDEPWDGPAAVAAMPADDTVLGYCHAWEDSEAAATPHREGDDDADDQKRNYKFPHHKAKGGPANLPACRNGLARLSSADIPAGDDAGVKAHLQAHLDDASGDDSGGSGSGNQAQEDVSGAGRLEQIREALKGAKA